MSRTYDVTKYVTRTPDGNIGVRDTQDNPYFWEQQWRGNKPWANDGFSPKLARKLAEEINRLADELEEEASKPKIENWPPELGDTWEVTIGDKKYVAYAFGSNGLTIFSQGQIIRGETTEVIERDASSWQPRLLFRTR